MRDKKKIIGSIVILIIFALFLIIGYVNSRPSSNTAVKSEEVFKDQDNTGEASKSKSDKGITVYVNGEVKNPGVYKLKNDSRIQDIVKEAGGFTAAADTSKLNLAKKLKDEDYIYVDKKGENGANKVESGGKGGSGGGVEQDGKVNINKASKEELKTISGVGDVTAQKIIDYREKNGKFSSIEDLKKVGRIGDKTIEKIKDKIDVR
ncbi:helix-hairpin-helix domain-containing protein [Clostridium autoethanogenum]|uniref:DNA-binding protein n=2 Tax=Clostridium autoethanogenum TaxID=84023 RepID=A0A3M0ST29_9CLOT|nr:helix-hairpin-helix domain-containing protein [Clostridium autoethanogenum]AGY77044.1 helix-hairpin-helix domain-containing protein [Clostridium autoethanogenum DSM 10061]ALU37186.1 Competence ComEA protein [Clostridium autoethanogenum DSM 10061]OVY50241.1 ComE operon protein 1 [Clostridium autoethanogenum]RMD01574.1 DNA-binding protein [Clostridium autoethanogenum]